MPALLILHLPRQPVLQRVLNDGDSVLLGRAAECDIVVNHDSVSRQHARLRYSADQGCVVQDLGSKNGIRIDGKRSDTATLRNSDWFALGDVFCQLRLMDDGSAQALGQQATLKRHSSSTWTRRLDQGSDAELLLKTTLAGIVELADCRRGFLLAAGGGGQLEVRAVQRLNRKPCPGARFLAVAAQFRERCAIAMLSFSPTAPNAHGCGIRSAS